MRVLLEGTLSCLQEEELSCGERQHNGGEIQQSLVSDRARHSQSTSLCKVWKLLPSALHFKRLGNSGSKQGLIFELSEMLKTCTCNVKKQLSRDYDVNLLRCAIGCYMRMHLCPMDYLVLAGRN